MIANCPKCGKKTAFLNNRCEHCGCNIRICPECGNITESETELCDYCGFKFLTEEEKKVEDTAKIKQQAKGLIEKSEKRLKALTVIARACLYVGTAIFIIVIFMSSNFLKTELNLNDLIHLEDKYNTLKILIIVSLLLILLAGIIDSWGKFVLFHLAVSDIMKSKFNYKRYLKIIPTTNNGDIYISVGDGKGEVVFTNAVVYIEKPSLKNKKIVLSVISTIIKLVCVWLIYQGLIDNLNTMFAFKLIEGQPNVAEFVFKFYTHLIIGLVGLILWVILEPLFDMKTHGFLKFIKQYQQANN